MKVLRRDSLDTVWGCGKTCAPDLRANSRRRDVSDLKDERPGVGLPTPNRRGAGWDPLHHTQMRSGASGVFLCIAGEKHRCRLLEYHRWAGIKWGSSVAIAGSRGAESWRRACDLPEMENQAERPGSERVWVGRRGRVRNKGLLCA